MVVVVVVVFLLGLLVVVVVPVRRVFSPHLNRKMSRQEATTRAHRSRERAQSSREMYHTHAHLKVYAFLRAGLKPYRELGMNRREARSRSN